MSLSEGQLCNLHIALSDMLPLPEQLVRIAVEGMFGIENWEPTDEDGFYLDNAKAQDYNVDSPHFYVHQSQIWSQLSHNEYGSLDDDESKSNYQNKFNSHKDEVMIDSVKQTQFDKSISAGISKGASRFLVKAFLRTLPVSRA